jgi:hypothetical protein
VHGNPQFGLTEAVGGTNPMAAMKEEAQIEPNEAWRRYQVVEIRF